MAFGIDAAVLAAMTRMQQDFPQLLNATRANPARGVSRFNVPRAMLRAALWAVADLSLGSVISDQATGHESSGATVESIGGFTFGSTLEARVTDGINYLEWSGPQGRPWVRGFCVSVGEGFMGAVGLEQVWAASPTFEAVDGDASQLGPGLFPAASQAALRLALLARLEDDGRFTRGDAGVELTPQIRRTATGLSIVLAGLLNDLQAAVLYNSGSTSGDPISGSPMSWTLR